MVGTKSLSGCFDNRDRYIDGVGCTGRVSIGSASIKKDLIGLIGRSGECYDCFGSLWYQEGKGPGPIQAQPCKKSPTYD